VPYFGGSVGGAARGRAPALSDLDRSSIKQYLVVTNECVPSSTVRSGGGFVNIGSTKTAGTNTPARLGPIYFGPAAEHGRRPIRRVGATPGRPASDQSKKQYRRLDPVGPIVKRTRCSTSSATTSGSRDITIPILSTQILPAFLPPGIPPIASPSQVRADAGTDSVLFGPPWTWQASSEHRFMLRCEPQHVTMA
jgi:hypothetical protein